MVPQLHPLWTELEVIWENYRLICGKIVAIWEETGVMTWKTGHKAELCRH